MDTHLVIHHCVANVVSQTGQCLGILDVIKESCDFAPLCQRFQIPESLFQFPANPTSASIPNLDIK